MKTFQACIYLLASFLGGYAQPSYRMESLTVSDGLSQGFVLELCEDSRGFIWISTFNGLNRYDGYEVKRFSPDNTTPGALKTNYIYAIAEDVNGLLWMGTDKGLVVMDPYTEQFIHLAEINPAFPIAEIFKIQIKDNRIWMSEKKVNNKNEYASQIYAVTPAADLAVLIRDYRITPEAIQIQPIVQPAGVNDVLYLLENQGQKEIAVKGANGQIYKIDPATLKMEPADVRTLVFERLGKWGLVHFDKYTGFIVPLPEGPFNTAPVTTLSEFIRVPGQMPVLYDSGSPDLYKLDTSGISMRRGGGFEQFRRPFFRLDQASSIKGIMDRNGNLWMGTTGFGVRVLRPKKISLKYYESKISFYNFRFLPDGNIWPGRGYPKTVLNPSTGQSETAPWTTAIGSRFNSIYNLLITQAGDWWIVASRGEQLLLFKKHHTSGQWKEIPVDLAYLQTRTVQIQEDNSGKIWMSGAGAEIIRIDPESFQTDRWSLKSFFPEHSQQLLQSNCLVKDRSGTLWLGNEEGLVRIEHPQQNPVFKAWHNTSGKGVLFTNNRILSIYPDENDARTVWLSTYGGGLHRFDLQTETTEKFTEKDGLVDNVVYGIVPDNHGYLWLSTNRGISRFNPQNNSFYNSIDEDPALSSEFNTDAFGKTPAGEMAFGGVNGLSVISSFPDAPVKHPAMVAITAFKINGELINTQTANNLVHVNGRNEYFLKIPFNKNNLSIEFTALHAENPASALFRYRIPALSKQWISTDVQRAVSLAMIPAGDYTIDFQTINLNGEWENAPITSVHLTILPAWYRSWPACIFYVFAMVALILLLDHFRQKRAKRKQTELARAHEMKQLKALDEFKTRFLGSISHEIKTPLTIIMGHAKKMADKTSSSLSEQYAKAIIEQGENVQEMIEQIIDVTRLENQNLQLKMQHGNLSSYLQHLVESIRPLADFRNIQLDFQSSLPGFNTDYDPLRLKYIISNLITNAIRHTPSGGLITVQLDQPDAQHLRLVVEDNGEGISPEDLPNIFERYYTGKNKTYEQWGKQFGIGLAFVRDLVHLFQGDISVKSAAGAGTAFTIILPVIHKAPSTNGQPIHSTPLINNTSWQLPDLAVSKNLPLLLIVEDNPFISKYLQEMLIEHYNLAFAGNGKEGFEKALELVPDLIITDVMMPVMDGFDLTQQLKSHEVTNHIPVVMLSARSGLEYRIEGHQKGADAYLGKPFDKDELLLVLHNLNRLQSTWRERYASLKTNEDLPEKAAGEPGNDLPFIQQQTDAFMLKIYALFEKNYHNETFSHAQLCQELEMSRSQLHRKLASLSAHSAMELLRQFRLQKAYQIFAAEPHENVKEVCFRVGFKDPSHFSRLFSKTFQMSPSDVKKHLQAPVADRI